MTGPLSSAQNLKRLRELFQTNKWVVAAELIVLCALCFARLFPFSIQNANDRQPTAQQLPRRSGIRVL